MFARRPSHQSDSFSKHRATKSITKTKRSFRDAAPSSSSRRVEKPKKPEGSPPVGSTLTSPIITFCVGPSARLFAAHENILAASPQFTSMLQPLLHTPHPKRLSLPDELPEIFSSVLEYLYKGDYYPRLLHNKRRNTWELEDAAANANTGESVVFHPALGENLLKDTVLYCAAEKYGLTELKKLALKKQGLQSGVQCGTVLASARYAYTNTEEGEERLRAHYLALIIRSRNTFKRSGSMQNEMEKGGRLFFDLFVAMCNHMDDLSSLKSPR